MALEVFQQMLEEEHLEKEPEASKYFSDLLIITLQERSIFLFLNNSYSYIFIDLADTEELSEFLAEDREADIQRSKTSQAEIQKLVRDTLQL